MSGSTETKVARFARYMSRYLARKTDETQPRRKKMLGTARHYHWTGVPWLLGAMGLLDGKGNRVHRERWAVGDTGHGAFGQQWHNCRHTAGFRANHCRTCGHKETPNA